MRLPKLMTPGEAAAYANKTPGTIYSWIAAGFLPARKRMSGRGWHVHIVDVDRCLTAPRKNTTVRTVRRPWYLRRLEYQRAKYRDKKAGAVRQLSTSNSRQGA